jgi:hypothetical protein
MSCSDSCCWYLSFLLEEEEVGFADQAVRGHLDAALGREKASIRIWPTSRIILMEGAESFDEHRREVHETSRPADLTGI